MLRILAKCAVVLLILSALSAESISQTSATVSLERAVLKAGEGVSGSVKLDIPAPCDGFLQLHFSSDSDSNQAGLDLNGSAAKGAQEITISGGTPLDYAGGDFTSESAVALNCLGYEKWHLVKLSSKVHVTIIPVPDTNVYPTQAKLELTVSQRQFLETKAHDVDNLLVRFANGIQKYPSTTEAQKEFLVSVIDAGQSALNDAEKEYRKQILKPDQPIPIFFEDFLEHYQELRTEVRSRKIAGVLPTPHLVLAQLNTPRLKKRLDQQKPSNSLTPDAEATQQLLEDTKRAYRYVEETGGAIFTTELISIPAGARVSYRRTTQPDFMDYPTPTNVTVATFPMAYLEFRFHKDNCGEDLFLRINPWESPNAPIEMEFTKCH